MHGAFRLSLPMLAVLTLLIGCANPKPQITTDPNAELPDDSPLAAQARKDPIALLEKCRSHAEANYFDYTCTFIKQERVNRTVLPKQTIDVAFRREPFSVGFKWLENPPRADRLLYVAGRWDNQMLVRPSGALARMVVPTAARDPQGAEAMEQTLRPVTRFGFLRGLQSLLDVYRQARQAGDLETGYGGRVELNGRPAVVLIRTLPDKNDYPAHVTRTYIDEGYLVPVRIEATNWDGQFQAMYEYTDIDFSAKLTDRDFRPEAWDLVPPKE